jgi:hypothetical protein
MPRAGARVNRLSLSAGAGQAQGIHTTLEAVMSDPLNPWEEKDRLSPSGDLSPLPEDDGPPAAQGDTGNGGSTDLGAADTDEPAREEAGTGTLNTDTTTAEDANDLEADNAVEADTLETLDPENPPV